MAAAHRMAVFAALLAAPGCTEDPVYLAPADQLEVNADPLVAEPATGTVTLPVSAQELLLDEPDRAMLEAELGVMVPRVRLGDLAVSIEWSVKNLGDTDGSARVHVNGGNEWVYFDPQLFVEDPQDLPPPPLMGDIPLPVPAGGLITGVFREDQFVEAAIDLELISRGGINAIAATLEVHEDTQEIVDPLGGPPVPRSAFAGMVRFDFVLTADAHMVMEYAVRVRDHRGILHDELLAAPAGELEVFAPTAIQPPPPPPP